MQYQHRSSRPTFINDPYRALRAALLADAVVEHLKQLVIHEPAVGVQQLLDVVDDDQDDYNNNTSIIHIVPTPLLATRTAAAALNDDGGGDGHHHHQHDNSSNNILKLVSKF